MTRTTATFSSALAPALKRYVDLKRALGRRFDTPDSHSRIAGPISPGPRYQVLRS